MKNIKGATFIYSLWEGYLPNDTLQNMIRFIKKKHMKFYQVHTSGHAEMDSFLRLVRKREQGGCQDIRGKEGIRFRKGWKKDG